MEITKKRLRKDFEPITLAMSLVCISDNSPVRQVYNAALLEIEPERVASPCTVLPHVVAATSDNSWVNGRANSLLASMVWKVDGVDITGIPAWIGLYSIETTGENKGALIISRNLYPSEHFALSFEAVITDLRFGINVPVKIDGIALSCADKSEDDYSISIGEDEIIKYDPFKDNLLLYEYKVAHGIIAGSTELRAAAKDLNCFDRTIALDVYQGKNIVTEGVTMKLFKVTTDIGGNAVLTETTGTDYEIVSKSTSAINIDLRLITKAEYLIIIYVNSSGVGSAIVANEVARKQFSINRLYPKFIGEVVSGAGILPGDRETSNRVAITKENSIVPYPECVLKIDWFSDAYDAITGIKTNTHNEGQDVVIELEKAGMGDNHLDNWLDIYFRATQKGAFEVAVDESAEVFTDENDEILIFN